MVEMAVQAKLKGRGRGQGSWAGIAPPPYLKVTVYRYTYLQFWLRTRFASILSVMICM